MLSTCLSATILQKTDLRIFISNEVNSISSVGTYSILGLSFQFDYLECCDQFYLEHCHQYLLNEKASENLLTFSAPNIPGTELVRLHYFLVES